MRILTTLIFVLLSSVIHSESIPIETFFKNADIRSPRISPDGKHIAAAVKRDGQYKVIILDLKTFKAKQVISVDQTDDADSVWWVNNERIMFMTKIQTHFRKSKLRLARIYAINIDGSHRKLLGGTKGNYLNMLWDDPKYALVYGTNWKRKSTFIYRENIYSGTLRGKQRVPTIAFRVLVDKNLDVRMVSGYIDEYRKEIATYYRKNRDADWELVEKYDRLDGGLSPIKLTDDGKQAYIYNGNPDKGEKGFYLYSFESKEKELIWKHKFHVDVSSFLYDFDKSNPKPIGIEIYDGRPQKVFFDENHSIAKIYRSLESAFPQSKVSIINFSFDYETALVYVSSDVNPGEYFLYKPNKGTVKFLLASKPLVKPSQMSHMEPISFQTRDKLTIHGYITKPKHLKPPYSLVLKVHGGPFGVRDYWGFDEEDQFLASRGYAVLKVNYRGSGGYGTRFQYDAYKKMGAEMQDDLTDATQWAIDKGLANKDKICIYGGSYGGYAAMMGVVKEPDLYQCAIPFVGVYDIELMHKKGDIQRSDVGEDFLEEAWGDDEAFFIERSPIHHLKNLKAGLFIVHGEKDERADFSHYEALTEKLDELKYPYESLTKAGEGHGFLDDDNQYDFYNKMEIFLNKYIQDKRQKK